MKRYLLPFVLVIPGAAVSGTFAAEPPSKPVTPASSKSLDTQLLDDLNADLLGGLPDSAKPAAAGKQPKTEEGRAASEATDPLAIIGERMRAAQQRIAGQDTSPATQEIQQKIIDDLTALIEQARKQCAACKKPGSGQGQQAGNSPSGNAAPPRDSTNRIEQGTKEAAETADVKDVLRRFWGHLPDKLRDQMNSSLSEQFLPKYERLIEDYYKRLAEDPRAKP